MNYIKYIITANVQWVAPECGGKSMEYTAGSRFGIRWQNYVAEWLEVYRDIQLIKYKLIPGECYLVGEFVFYDSRKCPIDKNMLKKEESFELLDTCQVIGIGKIIDVHISTRE
jgi:hypothetical protein